MNIGQIDLDDNRGSNVDSGPLFYNDLPRLILLLFMVFAAITGAFINSHTRTPEKILQRSVDTTLGLSFRASLEGTTTLGYNILGAYRSHQAYTPETGITIEKSRDSGYDDAPFNSLSALELLRYATEVNEHEKEDIYGEATRHFSGPLVLPSDDESTSRIFEYWIEMRKFHAVRLIISEVNRFVDVDAEGDSLSSGTFLNIRYHNWK